MPQKEDQKQKPKVTKFLSLALLAFLLPIHAFAATAHLKENAPRLIAKTESAYGRIITTAALSHDVDPKLILAVIVVESEGNPRALSRRGAQGLMQLMPQTAKALGVKDPREPLQNVLGGTKYLKELEERYAFIRTPEEVLVAYNMGPTRAKHWLSRFSPEQYAYVVNVMYVYDLLLERERYRTNMGNMINNEAKILAEEFTESILNIPQPILTRPRALSLAVSR
ncbi:MAG: lytic transglycosylase domain-containing protein [bacterium]|nr:lytic transglycosylase domain-containing protein [bacterium]